MQKLLSAALPHFCESPGAPRAAWPGKQQAQEQAQGRAGGTMDASSALLLRTPFWKIRLQPPSRH